jgi:glycosyltransferase involved in cell wall biosynthesis
MTIWFDVGDLIQFFQSACRPTGIQRLTFETCRAAARLAGPNGDVGFCHRGTSGIRFRALHFPALEAGIAAILHAAPPAPRPLSRLAPALRRLPPEYGAPLGRLARAGKTAIGALGELARAPWQTPAPQSLGGHHFDLGGPAIQFGAGDWLVTLGANWHQPYPPALLAGLNRSGARFALLAHDMIPALFPEWCAADMIPTFRAWLDETVPQAARLFTVSHNTARDLQDCLAKRGHACPPLAVLPVGSAREASPDPQPRLVAEPYVLFVSTIEARKNHAGMLRVWRRLLATLPAARVPTLVFAGKIGWLTCDLMQQLENANYLGGKIRFIPCPGEAQLASLYQHCLFTVFPSFYEGWGLPVSESLSFGKTVAASRCAAIPEAGGEFCAYFDPDNLNDVYEVISSLIENPAQVAALEARIAAQYAPPGWTGTAAALLAALDGAAPAPAAAPLAPALPKLH